MRRSTLLIASAALAIVVGCREKETGNVPVGGTEASPLEQERFLKRLSMDLVGHKPEQADLDLLVAKLDKEGNSPDVRADIARDLVASPDFGATYVGDIEMRAFGGARAEDIFDLFCSVFITTDPACSTCAYDPNDPCGCACPVVAELKSEQQSIAAAPDDLVGGDATTTAISRRFAESQAFQLNGGTAEGTATVLFDAFLGRAPEAEEIRNVRAFVLGESVQGVEGILFLQEGSNYVDMMNIFFGSEVYREAAVAEVFTRFLGRAPTPPELGHFSAQLNPVDPDVRELIIAVVSSQEYFDQ